MVGIIKYMTIYKMNWKEYIEENNSKNTLMYFSADLEKSQNQRMISTA
jgi:hypothetical protein